MEKKKKKEAKPYRDEDLCKWIQDGELHARDLLIRQNLKFIRIIAGSFAINPWIGLDRDDLMQIGSMAMVDAAKSYDPDRGAKFETFMTPVLKNAMTDLIREHQKGFEFRAIDPEGTLNFQLLRIDDEIPDSNGQTIAEFVRDTGVIHPESREIRRESIAEIHKALNTIPEAQRMYLSPGIWGRRYAPFNGGYRKTLRLYSGIRKDIQGRSGGQCAVGTTMVV